MKILMLISGLIGLISCSDINKSEQLERLVNIDNTLDSVLVVLSDNTIDEDGAIVNKSRILNMRVKETNLDTISMNFAVQLDQYNRAVRDILPLQTKHKAIEKNTLTEKNAVEALIDDVNSASGKRNMYDEYINYEENNMSTIMTALQEFIQRREKVMSTYSDLHSVIDETINECKITDEVQ
jgi:hypothetical protein